MPHRRVRSLDDPDTLREFVRNIREGVYISTASGVVVDCNPAFLELFGVVSLEELREFPVEELVVDAGLRRAELGLLEREGRIREFEMRIRRPDGEIRTVLDTTTAWRDPDTGETYFHGILIDITARKELEERLREQTQRDPLTGAHNRRRLVQMEREIAERAVESWGCIFIDIDHFKQYNDSWGHEAGDAVLVRMARFLSAHVRAEESVVRVGGDEFVVVLLDSDAAATERVVRRLNSAALHAAPAPFSLGWAARAHGEAFQRTLTRADHNLLAVRVVERAPQRREED